MNVAQLVIYFWLTYVNLYFVWYFAFFVRSAAPPYRIDWFTHLSVCTILTLVSWIFAHFIHDLFNRKAVDPAGKMVLITGCDTGFGHDLALRLDQFGNKAHYHIF